MSMQLVQVLAASSVFIAFACAELWRGRFFPREATREDDRLDIVITLTFVAIMSTIANQPSAHDVWRYVAAFAGVRIA